MLFWLNDKWNEEDNLECLRYTISNKADILPIEDLDYFPEFGETAADATTISRSNYYDENYTRLSTIHSLAGEMYKWLPIFHIVVDAKGKIVTNNVEDLNKDCINIFLTLQLYRFKDTYDANFPYTDKVPSDSDVKRWYSPYITRASNYDLKSLFLNPSLGNYDLRLITFEHNYTEVKHYTWEIGDFCLTGLDEVTVKGQLPGSNLQRLYTYHTSLEECFKEGEVMYGQRNSMPSWINNNISYVDLSGLAGGDFDSAEILDRWHAYTGGFYLHFIRSLNLWFDENKDATSRDCILVIGLLSIRPVEIIPTIVEGAKPYLYSTLAGTHPTLGSSPANNAYGACIIWIEQAGNTKEVDSNEYLGLYTENGPLNVEEDSSDTANSFAYRLSGSYSQVLNKKVIIDGTRPKYLAIEANMYKLWKQLNLSSDIVAEDLLLIVPNNNIKNKVSIYPLKWNTLFNTLLERDTTTETKNSITYKRVKSSGTILRKFSGVNTYIERFLFEFEYLDLETNPIIEGSYSLYLYNKTTLEQKTKVCDIIFSNKGIKLNPNLEVKEVTLLTPSITVAELGNKTIHVGDLITLRVKAVKNVIILYLNLTPTLLPLGSLPNYIGEENIKYYTFNATKPGDAKLLFSTIEDTQKQYYEDNIDIVIHIDNENNTSLKTLLLSKTFYKIKKNLIIDVPTITNMSDFENDNPRTPPTYTKLLDASNSIIEFTTTNKITGIDFGIVEVLVLLYSNEGFNSKVLATGIFTVQVVTDEDADEEEITGDYEILDTNKGDIVTSTSLLFKNNKANVYNTLTHKDNTLFLGNYTTLDFVLKMLNFLNGTFNINTSLEHSSLTYPLKVDILIEPASEDNPLPVYTYTPNMLYNSQQKKLFKKGETYILGVVFVNKQGIWSSVYPLREIYSPLIEPLIRKNNTNTGYEYEKPIAKYTIPKEILNTLYLNDIVAMIPVYMLQNYHRILGLGFLCGTISNKKRLLDENIYSLYSWFYRNRLGNGKLTRAYNGGDSIDIEILSLQEANPSNVSVTVDSYNYREGQWDITGKILTLNTPEVEIGDELTNAHLVGCSLNLVHVFKYPKSDAGIQEFSRGCFRNYLTITAKDKGFKSLPRFDSLVPGQPNYSLFSSHGWRDGYLRTSYSWYGVCGGFTLASSDDNPEGGLKEELTYGLFKVYPWNRSTIGGEQSSSGLVKRQFVMAYNPCLLNLDELTIDNNSNTFKNSIVSKGKIYKDYTTNTTIQVEDSYYLGNIDYIVLPNTNLGYGIYYATALGNTLINELGINENGISKDGVCFDPIPMLYKCAPHIVLSMAKECVYDSDALIDSADSNIEGTTEPLKYDSGLFSDPKLYVAELVNDTVTIDTDPNTLSKETWLKCGDLVSFTILNNIVTKDITLIYEEGNYFYGRYDSLRTYPYSLEAVNSITEVVSGMVCSRVNLDSRVDTNRGVIEPILDLSTNFNIFNPIYNLLNNYFTFSYINYEDITYSRNYKNSFLWTDPKIKGAEVDEWCNIQDSNTMDLDGDKGTLYSLERVNNKLISVLESGIAVIQYNERAALATNTNIPVELANSGNVTGKYYLSNYLGTLNYYSTINTPYGLFIIDSINKTIYKLNFEDLLIDICFITGMSSWALQNINNTWWGYYDIYSKEIIFSNSVKSIVYDPVLDKFKCFVSYNNRFNINSNGRVLLHRQSKIFGNYYNFWYLKNSGGLQIFNKDIDFYITLIANPEALLDKIFTTLDYRADGFKDNGYVDSDTFTTILAKTEYQDTNEISLNNTKDKPSNLKKKFRIWHIDIPRNLGTRDRIRNPWMTFKLYHKASTNIDKFIFHDAKIQYLTD